MSGRVVDLAVNNQKETGLPLVVMGLSFKPNTAIQTGSCAVLLCNLLKEKQQEFVSYDPITDKTADVFSSKAVYIITCAHDSFMDTIFPDGSVVIDPHRKFHSCKGQFKYVPVGRYS